MWLAEGTGVWAAGVETVHDVCASKNNASTENISIGVYRPNAAHVVCVWTHKSPVGSSSGQAGRARTVETTPVGPKSLKQSVKQNQESTAACLANDIENMHVRPTCQI